MLWNIAIVLLLLWLLACVGFGAECSGIHLLLAAGLVLVVVNVAQGRSFAL